jgi:hypothetical protein
MLSRRRAESLAMEHRHPPDSGDTEGDHAHRHRHLDGVEHAHVHGHVDHDHRHEHPAEPKDGKAADEQRARRDP